MMGEQIAIDLFAEMAKFLDDSSLTAPGTEPEFVLILGGVCAGKTTVRKERYSRGHTVLDAGEIFLNLSRGGYYDFGQVFQMPLDLIGYGVALRAIQQRRNLVTEMMGDSGARAIEAMRSVGYKVDVVFVQCDLDTARQRNRNRGDDNISSYYTGPHHEDWILRAVRAASLARPERRAY